jgi:hypothetical protein
MTPDISRVTFDQSKHFSRVIMQQGRVQLDADWNEQAEIMLTTARRTFVDLIGPGAAPPDDPGPTPVNFKIAITPVDPIFKDLIIGKGRYYVDGILCDNTDVKDTITYLDQPYLEVTDSLESAQFPFLVYLDVWEEIVTVIDDPELLEPALSGLDTTARTRVQWAVRIAEFVPSFPRGGPPGGSFPVPVPANQTVFDKIDINAPAFTQSGVTRRGLIRADTSVPDADQDSVCAIAPDAQFRGTENQLYRVEIHTGGKLIHNDNPNKSKESPVVTPTFKWSRDNGSVAFVITSVVGSDGPWTVTLQDLGRDDRHTLDIGDWVEIFDAAVVRRDDQPVDLLKVMSIDPIEQTVDLDRALADPNGGLPPVIAYDAAAIAERRPILRRWDQTKGVTDPKPKNGPTPLGTIPIDIDRQRPVTKDDGGVLIWNPDDADTWFDLEDGIRVQFQRPAIAVDSVGVFAAGDYWLIPARTASNGTILWPRDPKSNERMAVEPAGPKHHYAPLAIVVDPKSLGSGITPDQCVLNRRPIINRSNIVIAPT